MLIKFANADLLEARVAHRGDMLMRTAHRAVFNYEPRDGFLYVRSRAISSRTNDNFDTWPAEELVESWQTFIGKPVFVNHHNKDHRRARGVIIDAVLHEDTAPDGTPDTWVEVLMEVDAVRFPKLAAAILAGDIERTSMGADVGESECSYCGNVASTPDTYCIHVQRHKGQRLVRAKADGTKEDVLVHEICRKISFFENSLLVEAPADPTAFFLGVDDTGVRSMGMQMRTASAVENMVCGTCGYQLMKSFGGWDHAPRTDRYPNGYPPGTNVRHKVRPVPDGSADDHQGDGEDDGLTDTGRSLLEWTKKNEERLRRRDAREQGPRTAAMATGKASRGFFCDIGSADLGREALALYHRLASKTATVEDILSVAASDGHVGSQWALEDQPDFAGWSDHPNGIAYDYAWTDESELVKNFVVDYCGPNASDEAIWDALEDNLGAIMVVLVGKTAAPYQNDDWDADIGSGAQITLDEVRYNAGWGWQTLRAAGRVVTAKVRDDAYVKLTPEQKQRFEGTTVRQDSKGFYCHTHRARSDSFPSVDEIPDDDVRFIESTGALHVASKSYTLVQGGPDAAFELHIAGCGDLSKSKYALGDPWTFEAESLEDALNIAIDDQLEDQGWSKSDVKVFSCARTGVPVETKPLDPSICPASGQAAVNPRRLIRMPCPECGKMLGGGRSMITKIPRHTPWKSASFGASEASSIRGSGTCLCCHEYKDLVGAGAICQECLDAINRGEPMYPDNPDLLPDDDRLASKLAWGEMKAPAVVDTLGLVECPVCGERSKFDTTGRCTVCGFLPPPEPFREPDLEVAQKVDMRDGWVNPDLMAAPAFTPPEEGDEGSSPVQDATPPNQGAERTGGTRMRPSEAIQRNAVAENARLRAENAALRARRADINNPGQPVPEPAAQSGVSTEEARQPDATADVTSTSGAALADVGPATTTDVTAPGAAITDVAPMAMADVTAPVAGGADPQSYADAVTKIEPDASGGTDNTPAFAGDNSWVQAKRQARAEVFAALRLARLRITAGIERGDDLSIAEKIASTVKPEVVRNEIATLTQVIRQGAVQQQQQRQASRPHVAQRSTPSLASMAVPGIQAVGGFAGLAVSQEEVNLFD